MQTSNYCHADKPDKHKTNKLIIEKLVQKIIVDLKSLKSRYKESLPKINYPCQGN
jgi:hypothetical protein